MDSLSVNWLVVVGSVLISMISGMIWYNPKTFFLIWWKGIGKSDADIPGSSKGMALTWSLTVLSSAVQGIFVSLAVQVAGAVFGMEGIGIGAATGLILWLGLVAPMYLVNNLFAGHGAKVWAIETGNHLVNLVLFGMLQGILG